MGDGEIPCQICNCLSGARDQFHLEKGQWFGRCFEMSSAGLECVLWGMDFRIPEAEPF